MRSPVLRGFSVRRSNYMRPLSLLRGPRGNNFGNSRGVMVDPEARHEASRLGLERNGLSLIVSARRGQIPSGLDRDQSTTLDRSRPECSFCGNTVAGASRELAIETATPPSQPNPHPVEHTKSPANAPLTHAHLSLTPDQMSPRQLRQTVPGTAWADPPARMNRLTKLQTVDRPNLSRSCTYRKWLIGS